MTSQARNVWMPTGIACLRNCAFGASTGRRPVVRDAPMTTHIGLPAGRRLRAANGETGRADFHYSTSTEATLSTSPSMLPVTFALIWAFGLLGSAARSARFLIAATASLLPAGSNE